MTKVWCVVGLPGSGKTFLGKCITDALNARFFDDITFVSQLPENGTIAHIVIIDPNFCLAEVQQRADKFLIEKYDAVHWLYFENDPEKCLVNVRYRNDGRKVEELIWFLHRSYHPGDVVIRIWQPPQPIPNPAGDHSS